MNYCEHHLGDYAKRAGHLSMLEHGAYALLRDRYFDTEKPIPADMAHRVARAKTKDERAAVDVVLAEFYTLEADGWHCAQFDADITKAQARIKAAAENGKLGGRPKRTQQKPTGLDLGSIPLTQVKALQTPDTRQIPSEPDGSGAKAPPAPPSSPELDPKDTVFGVGVPMLVAASVPERNARSFLAAQCKAHGDAAVADALHRCADERPLQPIPWLTAALKPRQSRHAGFASKDYTEGVTEDGHLA